jgi:molybdopterin-guanine dinucleotide biosynthesis protein A
MLSIVIQAGGQSSRMGRDKALLPLAGRPIIEHILERVEGLGDEVFITTNHPARYAHLGIRLESDRHPGAGALEGLFTALSAARGERILVLACDMPFVSPSLLAYMIGLSPESDVVVPRHAGKFEPLHAIYSRDCIPFVGASLDAGETRVLCFFPQVRVRIVEEKELIRFDPALQCFFNINTTKDLARAEQLYHHPGIYPE